jgi:hypothetical protein
MTARPTMGAGNPAASRGFASRAQLTLRAFAQIQRSRLTVFSIPDFSPGIEVRENYAVDRPIDLVE